MDHNWRDSDNWETRGEEASCGFELGTEYDFARAFLVGAAALSLGCEVAQPKQEEQTKKAACRPTEGHFTTDEPQATAGDDAEDPERRHQLGGLHMREERRWIALLILSAGVIVALLICTGLISGQAGAQETDNDQHPRDYNPYPPGILPSDLSSQIAPLLLDLTIIERRPLSISHALH